MARSIFDRLRKAWPQHLSPEDVGGKRIANNPDTQAFMAPHQDAVMEGRGEVLPVKPIPKPAGAVVSGNKRAIRAESQYKDFRPDEPGGPSTRWAMTGPASLRTRAANRSNGQVFGISTPANQNIIEGRSGQNVSSDMDPSGGWATNSWNTPHNDALYWNQAGTDSHNEAFPIPTGEFNGNPVHFKWSQYPEGTYIDAHIDNRGGGNRYGTSLAQWKINPGTGTAEIAHMYSGIPAREIEQVHNHLNTHLASLQGMHKNAVKMAKALPPGAKLNVDRPGDQTANNTNRQGFPGSPQHMVMEDAAGGPEVRGVRPVAPTHGSVVGLLQQIGKTGEKPGHNLVRYIEAQNANRVADIDRGWSNNTDEMFFDNPAEPARTSVRPNGASHNLASGFANQLNENDEFDRRNERRFWSHPNFYEWHDTHTSHHNPRPWDKQQAIETARQLGLIKNDQAAGVGTPRYAEFASPYGTVNPGQKSNLLHYDYHNKLQDVAGVVARHGFKTYYAGGQHGKPDLANRNYDTGHLMIPDPTPQSGGDFGERNYTDAWRQMHELSHALTHHDVNKVYGEARRIGALGQHRTLHEAQRSVHWEWLAAHKQRELNKQIGIHVPDETFHKELNTIMHDAVHRAVTGKFTEPSQEGFTPHSHKVPLEVALDTVRKEGTRLGLAGHHELIRKHEAKPMVKFVKALPKTAAENRANAGTHAVMEDAILEQGGVRKEHPNANMSANNNLSRQPHLMRENPETQLAMRRASFANMASDPYHSGKEPWNQANWSAPAEEPLWDAGDKMADRDYWDTLRRDMDKVKAVGRSPILKRKK